MGADGVVDEVTSASPRAARLRVSTARLLVVAAVICYVIAFNLTYRDFVSPIFQFWGLGYRPIPAPYFWTTCLLCVLPSTWMPVSLTRPSLLLFYLQYFLIFVPAAFVTFHSIRPYVHPDNAMSIVWMMFAGLSIIEVIYVLPVRPIRFLRVTPSAFWTVFAALGSVMLGYIAITLRGTFRLANFTDIYSIRFAMADIISATGSRFGLYAQFLLLSFFFPMTFAVGAFSRQWSMIALAAAGYVFLFGVGGAKAAVLATVYLPLIYLMVKPRRRVALRFAGSTTAALLSAYVTTALLSESMNAEFLGVLHFRSFTVPALTIAQYAGFFQIHPVTHLASVTGFSWLIQSPYDSDIPYMLGRYYYSASIGLNSGMWAGDGIVGFGLWGIPLISVVCSVVFWILDSIAADMDPAFVAVVVAYCGLSFTNISLFTTLISGGLGFTMATLLVAPRDAVGRIALPVWPRLQRMSLAPTR
ncbi:MAG: hypothetical protein JWM95_5217 [Gemmatimonadetes bacterium]|nr:hypothetical protein [Gemmatimonadota bacterium]